MKILFLGGTGNISTECAALLHKNGNEIAILSRGSAKAPSEYRMLKADRKNPTAMREALAEDQYDVVINFLGFELSDVQNDFAIFSDRTRQYIFISSATVYAKPPLRVPISEDAPLGNIWWDY